MSKNVLVTWGLGFVGGRIALYLLENTDYNVIVTSRNPQNFDHQSVKSDAWKRVKLKTLDVTADDKQIEETCNGVDCIIHCAALDENISKNDPIAALNVNANGTLKLLNAAIKCGVKRFIYFSTAHVYGAPLSGVLTEETLTRPNHPYAITHKVAEDFVLAAHDNKQIEGVVFRLSNSYGGPISACVNRWTLLFNDLCRQIVENELIVLKSLGLQKRDFICLTDVCIVVAHFIQLSPERLENGLFNLGSDATSLSVMEVAKFICDRYQNIYPNKRVKIKLGKATELVNELEYVVTKLKKRVLNF